MKIKQFVNIPKENFVAEWEKNAEYSEINGENPENRSKYARQNSDCCKIGEMTIKKYKTEGNKGRMTKYATKL